MCFFDSVLCFSYGLCRLCVVSMHVCYTLFSCCYVVSLFMFIVLLCVLCLFVKVSVVFGVVPVCVCCFFSKLFVLFC